MLLDASVWLAAVDEDDSLHHAARALVRCEEHRHVALDLTVYEVVNVAARAWGDAPAAGACVAWRSRQVESAWFG